MADSIGEFEVDVLLREYSVVVMAPSFFNVGIGWPLHVNFQSEA